MTVKMILNEELNGVELYFDNKPSQDILDTLKASGYRWSNYKKCWYAKQNSNTLAFAEQLTSGDQTIINQDTNTQAKTTRPQNKVASLYDRIQFTPGTTNTNAYRYKFVGSNYTGLPVKETAAEIRKHLRTRFPEVKFSITSDYNSISITIKSSPYCNKKLEYHPDIRPHQYRDYEARENPELTAIYNYCEKLLSSYNFDDSDSQTDYFHCHYYDHMYIDRDYIQTEQTEAIKTDIEAFRNQLVIDTQAEEARKEAEWQEQEKQREIEHQEYLKRQEEEKNEIEIINNSIVVKPLTESEQYFVVGSQFAHLNKNNTIEEYQEEIAKDKYSLETVKITREIHFTTQEALDYFSHLLLCDFDFLADSGGSFTDDPRMTSMTDYEQMDKEERETIKWMLYGIAVYHNNELQFVVDTQGHSYARYVGLVDNVTIVKTITAPTIYTDEELEALKEKAETLIDFSTEAITCDPQITNTWNTEDFAEYKNRMKQILKKNYFKLSKQIIQQIPEHMEEFKIAMYRLLKEVDGIQDQFKNANLQQGQKFTLFDISDFGMMSTQQGTFDHFECCEYAQYKNAVKIVFKPKNKRGLYYTYKYRDLLIYPGWLELPVEVLHTVERTGTGVTMTRTKYMSCDHRQYDEVINHFSQQGILPIVNTHKPII
jgi:hypothetical protein